MICTWFPELGYTIVQFGPKLDRSKSSAADALLPADPLVPPLPPAPAVAPVPAVPPAPPDPPALKHVTWPAQQAAANWTM